MSSNELSQSSQNSCKEMNKLAEFKRFASDLDNLAAKLNGIELSCPIDTSDPGTGMMVDDKLEIVKEEIEEYKQYAKVLKQIAEKVPEELDVRQDDLDKLMKENRELMQQLVTLQTENVQAEKVYITFDEMIAELEKGRCAIYEERKNLMELREKAKALMDQ